ncbi:hypothetical protein Ga0100230_016530 [Opitutaceae bacterium TAV3]|nr:hypothetical protein Ga0100230_016530 [Opitutaceae bacterium TAV3]
MRTAHGVWREREGLLVRLTNETGQTGFGEAAPIPWFGTESVDEAEACLRDLGGGDERARTTDELLDAVPARLGCVRCALAMARRPAGGGGEGGMSLQRALPVAALLPAGRAALECIGPKRLVCWLVKINVVRL